MASLTYIPATKLSELLVAADPKKNLCVRVLNNRLVLGADPFSPSAVIDFSNEQVVPYSESALEPERSLADVVAEERASRKSGEYWFELKAKRVEARSLRDLLKEALLAIEAERPRMLQSLSMMMPRSRRIVSQEPRLLFQKRELVEKYAAPLCPGWFYGTNNSAAETNAWLLRACQCARLEYGKDFICSLAPSIEDLL
jgi:hypothetical protein